MSTLYECTAVIKKENFEKIKQLYEDNGRRIKFGKPFTVNDGNYMVCFDSNGSLYDGCSNWFTKSLKNIVAYEENCIEDQDPYFFTYVNGQWDEGEKSILRMYYKVPKYFNEKFKGE